jgi:hypothetical protein
MSLKDTLRRAAGLLVELPQEEGQEQQESHTQAISLEPTDDIESRLSNMDRQIQQFSGPPPTRTVDQIVRESEGPNLDEIKVPASVAPPTEAPDGSVEFGAIYQHAKLPASPFTAEQMLDLLSSLPAELPLEMRRQTVRASLNAMGKALGATPDSIVADASRKLAALSAYIEQLSTRTTERIAAEQLEIAALEAKIQEKKKSIETNQKTLTDTTAHCKAESERLDNVLEFFSLDLPPSRYAAPDAGKP